jgi:hypothetical protein
MAVKVYLDTNVYKFSATQLPRLLEEAKEVNWGGRKFRLPVQADLHGSPL